MRKRQLKNAVLVGLSIAFACFGLPAQAAGPTLHDLKIVKECSQYTGDTPSFCTVIESNVDAIPKGTEIYYYGPDLGVADPVMTSSTAMIAVGAGDAALGYCIVDQRDAANQVGMCAFDGGSGTLGGFNAIIKVTEDAQQNFHWDGSYWTAGK